MATGSTGYVTDPSSGIQYDPGTGNTPNGGNISDVSPLTPSGQYGSVQANGGTTQNGAAPGGAAANGLIASSSAEFGQMSSGSLVMISTGIFLLYLAGIIAPPLALIACLALLGIDLLTGGVTRLGAAAEKTVKDAIDKLTGGASGSISGILADGAILVTILGVVYLIRRKPNGQVVVIQGGKVRQNPSRRRRRPLRRVRAL